MRQDKSLDTIAAAATPAVPSAIAILRISGAQAFSRPNTQKKLLAGDGIRVSADNRVDLKRFGWHNTLDEALFLRQEFERLGI